MGIRLSIFAAILTLMAAKASATIFGTDDRQEVYRSARTLKLNRSIATMVSDVYFKPGASENTIGLDFLPASNSNNLGLCSEEKFSSQPSGWLNCTAFLIADDLMVTAGHCMIFSHGGGLGVIQDNSPASAMCDNFEWMFDYQVQADGKTVNLDEVSRENIYGCKEVVYAEHTSFVKDPVNDLFTIPQGGQHGPDFAVFRLDRKVIGREPLKLAPRSPLIGESLLLIGYPSALPAKYVYGRALTPNFSNYIRTDHDIFSGNSGSPVFNTRDEVVGVTVRSYPGEDYTYLPARQCSKANACSHPFGKDCVPEFPNEITGTHINKIQHVIDKLRSLEI